jgi:hypothetical protein
MVEDQLKALMWLDPTIPITLARKIRDDQGDSFAESFDKLLPFNKFHLEQTNIVKDLVRALVDMDTISFHKCHETSIRLVRIKIN